MNNQLDSVSSTSKTEIIKEIKSLMKKTVLSDLDWYRKATRNHMITHRFLGVVIIALSVSLPLFVTLDEKEFPNKNLLVSFIGVLIAFISGLRSFFRWGETYITNMRGFVELKNYVSAWELAIIEAENNADSEEAIKLAVKATKKLILARDVVDSRNTEDYSQYFNSSEIKIS